MMFGAGGTAVEVARDIAHALPPLDLNLARDLMRQTRVWRFLQGYRDRPAADIERIAETLVRLSYLVANHAADPRDRHQSAAGRRQGRHRARRPGGGRRPGERPARADGDPALSLAMGGGRASRARGRRSASARSARRTRGLYADFFAHVTPDDQRLRFFTVAPELSHRFLARLTQIDYAREMAFVAIAKASGALLGVVRLVADPDYVRAEYAILVRSDLKGLRPRLAADAAPHRLRASPRNSSNCMAPCSPPTPPCCRCAASSGLPSSASRETTACAASSYNWPARVPE